ncbi:MAG: hypothetical protein KGL95_15640, partial [Patescibacteria group bacterium]|nr:hypothetical protein [Patescibacteria group bacterium]
EGGFRDATKLLEEVVALSEGKKITLAFVEGAFHMQGVSAYLASLLNALASKNIQDGMKVVGLLVEQGIDMKFFTSQLIDTLHSMLLIKLGVMESQKKLADKFSVEDIQILLSLSMDSVQQLKSSLIVQLPLELLVIAWCGQGPATIQFVSGSIVASGKQTMETLLKKERNLKIQNLLHPKEKEAENPKLVAQQPDITTHSNGHETLMENIIYKVKSVNASVAGVLRGCAIVDVTDGVLVFETAYKFHKERLEEAKTYAIIEKTVREVTGKSLKVTVRLKK